MSEHEHMSGQPAHAGGHHGHTAAEADRANVGVMGLILAMAAILLAVTSYMLWVYFQREAEVINYEQVLSRPSAALEQLRAQEDAWLSTYGVVNAEAKTYRLPIDAGKQLFLKEAAARRAAGQPQVVAPAPAAAPEGTEEAPKQ